MGTPLPHMAHSYMGIRTPSAVYILMEYVEGTLLSDVVIEKGSELIQLGLVVAYALNDLHEASIAHRGQQHHAAPR